MRIGVIGLGNIGGHLAGNLAADGHDVTVFDRDADARTAAEGRGATLASDAAGVAKSTEITLLSLPTPEIVSQVASEWQIGAAAGSILIDTSTNAPETVTALGEQLEKQGCQLLEAPLTGGAPGAKARMLVFMVGGDPAAFERCRPVLDALSRAVFYLGPLGTGNTAKLINSLLAFTSTWVSLEGLAMASRRGVDLRTMVEVVRTAGAGNFFIDRMVEGINERGRPTQFALELAAKAARLIDELASGSEVPAPVASQLRGILEAAVAGGLGERDWSDLVVHMEQAAGVTLHLPPAKPEDA